MRARLVQSVLALAASAALLAACGAPTPPPDVPSADGTAYRFVPEAPDAIAVGLVLITPDLLPADVSASELIEVGPDVFAGEFALVGADGAFSVPLPAAADVPAATLVPLADAVANFSACTVDASPLAAEATFTVFEGVTVPGLIALTSEGTFLMYATDAELDPDAMGFEGTAYGWMFVDRDAQLSTSGCAYEADLELSEGWNQLAWTSVASTVMVEVVPETDVFATAVLPFPPIVVVLGPDAE